MVTAAEKELAFDILKNKKVNIALLVKCFDYPDDPFLLKADPTMCRGLYEYNNTYEPGDYWREPLDINEYNFLKGVLKYTYGKK